MPEWLFASKCRQNQQKQFPFWKKDKGSGTAINKAVSG
jgi:hypothetical protein